jgi:hypothetical protein
MGTNSRYDRFRPVSDGAAGEARALHAIARLVGEHWPLTDRSIAGQISHVLDSAAIELNAGRAMPIGVRRSVLGLADALRVAMDPRPKSTDPRTPPPSGT